MARTVAYVQEYGYDSYEKLSDTTDTIQSKMAKARSDAKFTEAKLKKVNEQIRYLGCIGAGRPWPTFRWSARHG